MKTGEWKVACQQEGIPHATFFRLKKKLIKSGMISKSAIDKTWMRNS